MVLQHIAITEDLPEARCGLADDRREGRDYDDAVHIIRDRMLESERQCAERFPSSSRDGKSEQALG